MARVYDTDDYLDVAKKIFNEFEVGQSCTVKGVVIDEDNKEIFTKGEMVLKELRRLDSLVNVSITEGGRLRRKRKILPNSIGGYVAHKIFKWAILEGSLEYYNIWRIQ